MMLLVWIAAGVLAGLLTAVLVVGLWAMDSRSGAAVPPQRAPLLPPGEAGHLAYARALHRAAGLYVEECEARVTGAVDRVVE